MKSGQNKVQNEERDIRDLAQQPSGDVWRKHEEYANPYRMTKHGRLVS